MPSIAVRDFGPIAHAEVELKPLTVLIGANNTGKSYLALAIYALSRAIGGGGHYGVRLPVGLRALGSERADRLIGGRFKDAVGDLAKFAPEFDRYFSGEVKFNELPHTVLEWVRAESMRWDSALADDVAYELRRCFGSSLSQLGRRNRSQELGQFGIVLRDEAGGFHWAMRCMNDRLISDIWETEIHQASMSKSSSRLPPPGVLLGNPEFLGQFLLSEYSKFLTHSYSAPSHYMPATRSGILLGHKTLASLIVGRASSAWIEPLEIGRLPGVVTDLIQALLSLEHGSPTSHEITNTIEFLESDVLDGTVDIDRQLEYPDISYNNATGEFQLHQVSSMVSEIAPLILFLKYLVRTGDLFIFEEPESHLDPANQRRVARAIAMLVNAGVQVLVTTHSDVFLNQINNLMRISQIPTSNGQHIQYNDTEILDSSDVAAYMFEPSPEGTQAHRLPIDTEYGISTESFDKVHRALYDEAILMEHHG